MHIDASVGRYLLEKEAKTKKTDLSGSIADILRRKGQDSAP